MSVSSALDTAFSGLRAAQAGLDVVSQNVANAGTVGYTRRTLSQSQQVAGGRTTGVDVAGASRVLNTLVQKQLRLETAGAAYTGVMADTHTALDKLLDPTSGSNVSTLLDGLSSSFQTLNANPSSYTGRAGVVSAATTLASSLRSLSDGVTSLRQGAEDGLAQSVQAANGLLGQIADFDGRIVADPTSAALLDQRDGLIDQLSQYLDVKVTTSANGSVSLATGGGVQLYDGNQVTTLSFDPHSVTADSAWDADPAKRTLGTVTATDRFGNARDLVASGGIRSGQIAGYLDLRDHVLPEAQLQLDTLAAGISSALSDQQVDGTAASSGAASGYDLDLSGLQNGNGFTLGTTQGGAAKTITFVKASSAAAAAAATSADGGTVGIDFSGGMASVVSQVQAKLGSGFSVSTTGGSVLRVLDDGAAGTTDVTAFSARATVTGTTTGSSELPLFVDGGSGALYTGGTQLRGFASRIALNPAVTADNSTLVKYASSTAAGDATRPSFLLQRLATATVTAPGAVGIGGTGASFTGTLSALASGIITTQATAANNATSLDSGQTVALNNVQGRYSETAGVNLDSELTQLVQLQTAYSANARVIAAGKDMLDMLLRVGA